MQPVFASIMGSPSCGKSYFLAAMTWRLRKVLPRYFGLSFGDADPIGDVAEAEVGVVGDGEEYVPVIGEEGPVRLAGFVGRIGRLGGLFGFLFRTFFVARFVSGLDYATVTASHTTRGNKDHNELESCSTSLFA